MLGEVIADTEVAVILTRWATRHSPATLNYQLGPTRSLCRESVPISLWSPAVRSVLVLRRPKRRPQDGWSSGSAAQRIRDLGVRPQHGYGRDLEANMPGTDRHRPASHATLSAHPGVSNEESNVSLGSRTRAHRTPTSARQC